MGYYKIQTKRGYGMLDVASALQKAVRRGDARLAGYWAIELFESGFQAYLWRRLLTISAEDCAGVLTHEIVALFQSWEIIHKQKPGGGRIFAAKAVLILAHAVKSRDPDHLTNLVYDPAKIDPDALLASVADAQANPEPTAIPDYAFDCHTGEGKRAGRTKAEFFRDEHAALNPRAPGLFDADVEALGDQMPRKAP